MGTLSIFQGELADGCSDLYARGFITADGNTNKFPLKMKEPCITEAITILKKKGLFPDHDSDDDEMVFGDDDFPSADDEEEAPAEEPSAFVPKKAASVAWRSRVLLTWEGSSSSVLLLTSLRVIS